MRIKNIFVSALCVVLGACQTAHHPGFSSKASLPGLEASARRSGLELTLPRFETTPEAIKASTSGIIAQGDRALDRIARQDRSRLTFASTVGAQDDIGFEIS